MWLARRETERCLIWAPTTWNPGTRLHSIVTILELEMKKAQREVKKRTTDGSADIDDSDVRGGNTVGDWRTLLRTLRVCRCEKQLLPYQSQVK